jgi:hypothetical protein
MEETSGDGSNINRGDDRAQFCRGGGSANDDALLDDDRRGRVDPHDGGRVSHDDPVLAPGARADDTYESEETATTDQQSFRFHDYP